MSEDEVRATVLRDSARMIELLREPLPAPRAPHARIADWWWGTLDERRGWRQACIRFLEEIRKPLLRGDAVDPVATEFLVHWSVVGQLRKGTCLEAETDEVRSLVSSIRQGLGELTEQ